MPCRPMSICWAIYCFPWLSQTRYFKTLRLLTSNLNWPLGPTVPALYTLCVVLLHAQRIQCGCCIAISPQYIKRSFMSGKQNLNALIFSVAVGLTHMCSQGSRLLRINNEARYEWALLSAELSWAELSYALWVCDRSVLCSSGVPAMFVTVWASVRATLADTEWVTGPGKARLGNRRTNLVRHSLLNE